MHYIIYMIHLRKSPSYIPLSSLCLFLSLYISIFILNYITITIMIWFLLFRWHPNQGITLSLESRFIISVCASKCLIWRSLESAWWARGVWDQPADLHWGKRLRLMRANRLVETLSGCCTMFRCQRLLSFILLLATFTGLYNNFY